MDPAKTHYDTGAQPGRQSPEAIRVVSEALDRLRYGAIQLTVHDGKVMQIDITERTRLTD